MSGVYNEGWSGSFKRVADALERIASALERQNEREQARSITAHRGPYNPPRPPAITSGPRAIGTGHG